MKKSISVLVMSLVMTVCFTAQADLAIDRLWSSQFVTAPVVGTNIFGVVQNQNGDGAGWWTAIYNVTDGAETGGNTTATAFGWFTGLGYTVDTFQFTATEDDTVLLRLYNDANKVSATFRLDSASLVLPNLDNTAPPGPNDLNVTFNFSSSTWQAVPEPATALLFGIGGMGVWLLRRNKLKSKEEADA